MKADGLTQGNWKGAYGKDGYWVAQDQDANPAYVAPSLSGKSDFTWEAVTADVRALQEATTTNARIAACWYSATSFTIDLPFSDTEQHQVAVYCLDWDGGSPGRQQTVAITDPSGSVLDSQSLANFTQGVYLVWLVTGHVQIRVTYIPSVYNAVVGGLFFDTPGSASVSPVSVPAPALVSGRVIGGVQVYPSDWYGNSPVNRLPLDPWSAAKIALLGVGRIGPDYEFAINLANNQTPPAQIVWNADNGETDAGSYPFTDMSQVSNYSSNSPTNNIKDYTQANPNSGVGGDGHVLAINTDTGILYEGYGLWNNAQPYSFASGAVWDLKDYRLRTATKLIPPVVDSAGLTSADAAGLPITPFVLTHAEVYGGAPILHAMRITLPATALSKGYQWPATHASGGAAANGVFLGATLRLRPDFDIVTCHANDNTGQPWPAWFVQVLVAMQTYGLYVADIGLPLVSLDNDPKWGNTGSPTSDAWITSGWFHGILFSDLQVVDNQPRIISIFSGQVNPNFTAR